MAKIDYSLDESVAVVALNDGENRFNPDFLNAFLGILDDIERRTDASTPPTKKYSATASTWNGWSPSFKKGTSRPPRNSFFCSTDFCCAW